ncbi:MAG: hypothetical protein OEZ04_11250, partial [Nitrospinota bacterium]|nr:hypothetical protein [Nitrospinota bacterium]
MQRRRAEDSMMGLCDLTGEGISADQVADSVISAFAELYQIEFKASSLSHEEEETARMIAQRGERVTRHAGAV